MAGTGHRTVVATCVCGSAALELIGAPIMTVGCYCDSCRKAAEVLGDRMSAPPMTEDDGGTHFVIQRKDRVRCTRGDAILREHRLTPGTRTRRVVATCCNAAMFLEFDSGHWLSVFANRLDPAERPSIEQRTMTGDRPFKDDIPSPDQHTLRFMWKLMAAWAAMGFKAPKSALGRSPLQ